MLRWCSPVALPHYGEAQFGRSPFNVSASFLGFGAEAQYLVQHIGTFRRAHIVQGFGQSVGNTSGFLSFQLGDALPLFVGSESSCGLSNDVSGALVVDIGLWLRAAGIRFANLADQSQFFYVNRV